MSEINYLKGQCQECGNNIEFPEDAAGMVVACPHCGLSTELLATSRAKRRDGRRRGIALVIGAVVLAGATGVGGLVFLHHKRQTAANPTQTPNPGLVIPTNPPTQATATTIQAVEKRKKSPADLQAGNITLEKTKGSSLVFAVGTVKNDSDFQRFGVRVELDLFNQKGEKIGTAKDYINVIEPGGKWQFHALIPETKAVSAKMGVIKEED